MRSHWKLQKTTSEKVSHPLVYLLLNNMATPTSNTEWPSPALAEPVKSLINRAFEIADLKSEDCGERVAKEIFVPTGQMVINKQIFAGSEGMCKYQHSVVCAYGRASDWRRLYGVFRCF